MTPDRWPAEAADVPKQIAREHNERNAMTNPPFMEPFLSTVPEF
jgi:hypothetical protein